MAVLILTGIAAWARLSRPMALLDEARAGCLLAEEFPGRDLDKVWISDDGQGAVARSGDLALILYAAGDGYVARHLPWTEAAAAASRAGRVSIPLHDFAAPRAQLSFAAWPPN